MPGWNRYFLSGCRNVFTARHHRRVILYDEKRPDVARYQQWS